MRVAWKTGGVMCLFFFAAITVAEEGRPVEAIEGDLQVSFEADVLPIFRRNCLACHSESENEGELILETAATALEGGDSGPAIVPGNADESLLFQLAAHRTEPWMPPVDNDVGAKPLSPRQLGLIKLWIDQGAKIETAAVKEDVIKWQAVPEKLAPVHAIDVSRDGRWLAAGRGNQVVVYAVPAKREVHRLVDAGIAESHPGSAHLDIVQSIAFSPDQQTLVTGGFRCVKVWERSDERPDVAPFVGQYEYLPDGLALSELVDFQVSPDAARLLVIRRQGGSTVAQLLKLPGHEVIQEWSPDVYVRDELADLERNVGLRKERLRVAKADVEAAKKRKTDDENHVKKTIEELKKANEEVPKRKETFAKAEEAVKKKQDEIQAEEAKAEAAKQTLANADEKLKSVEDDETKNQLEAEKRQAAKQMKDAETAISNKQKELEKAQQEEKKRKQRV